MASHRVTGELHCIALQRIRCAPPCSVGGHVIGRNSTKRLAPRCRSWSRIFGEKTDPPFACPPSWESWSTGRLPVSLLYGLSVRPRTSSLLFFGSAGADHRLEPCRLIESLGELWWTCGKTARRPSSLCAFGRVLGMGSQ